MPDPKHDSSMVYVPESDFFSGNPLKNDTAEDQWERVPPFYIDKYPVTNRQYHSVNPGWRYDTQHADFPASGLSYDDILNYCRLTGKQIPTEIQWEKAARGDRDRRMYPWGNKFSKNNCNCRSFFFLKHQRIKAVDAYPKGESPYGCLDMSGNVWEWTSTSPKEDFFVLKGGSCTSPSKAYLAIHSRLLEHRLCINLNFGFRCCISMPEVDTE